MFCQTYPFSYRSCATGTSSEPGSNKALRLRNAAAKIGEHTRRRDEEEELGYDSCGHQDGLGSPQPKLSHLASVAMGELGLMIRAHD